MDNHDLEIVAIQRNEMEILSQLATTTFKESYYSQNEKSLFDNYVLDKLNPAQFEKEWQNENSAFYFVKWQGETCGYLKINFGAAQTETHNSDWMEIERIYILQSFQRKQLGTMLFNFALEKAREHQMKFIWVGVWKKNQKAIQFYERLGFEAYGVHLFNFGGEMQEDYILRYSL